MCYYSYYNEDRFSTLFGCIIIMHFGLGFPYILQCLQEENLTKHSILKGTLFLPSLIAMFTVGATFSLIVAVSIGIREGIIKINKLLDS